jgi:SET domain
MTNSSSSVSSSSNSNSSSSSSAPTHSTTSNATILTLEQVSINLLRTRHAHLRLNRSRVDASTIPNAGVGVFATRCIVIGEVITLYPGDALLQWNNATDFEDRSVALRVLLGPHITEMERLDAFKGTLFGRSMDAARAYEVRISDTISVVGDAQRCHDAAYLGHLLNDGACLSSSSNSSNVTKAAVTAYTRQSLAAANAKIVVGAQGCHAELVAMKPIAPGQEIFLSYGAAYWLSRLLPKQHSASRSPPTSSSEANASLGFASYSSRNSKRRKR